MNVEEKPGNRINDIVILGGGTSGWMTAIFLADQLKMLDHEDLKITLISSPDIGTIGVGEATIPSIANFFRAMRWKEKDWMPHCQATYKLGIEFTKWFENKEGDRWYHPFETPDKYINGFHPMEYWMYQYSQGMEPEMPRDIMLSIFLCQQKRVARFIKGETPFNERVSYAYHIDATLLGQLCKKMSAGYGVRHVEDTVTNVELDEKGFISSLQTKDSGPISGDLYIDCSGFRGMLINEVLKEPFIPFSNSLLCDRAVAMQIPHETESKEIRSHTTAQAMPSGWIWDIPLFHRTGNGYVYSSSFISDDDAETEFRSFLGPRSKNIPAQRIKMRVGRTRRTWVKNCIAIGLSAGFIEPLESTGLFFSQYGIENLAYRIPNKDFNPRLIDEYNQAMADVFEEVRGFIVGHYCTTNREDTPFWQANRHSLEIPDSLSQTLESWKNGVLFRDRNQLIARANQGLIFGPMGYFLLLNGMRCKYTDAPNGLDFSFYEKDTPELLNNLKKLLEERASEFPSHYEYLMALRKKLSPQETGSLSNTSDSTFLTS